MFDVAILVSVFQAPARVFEVALINVLFVWAKCVSRKHVEFFWIIITEKLQFCDYHVVLTWHQCMLHQNSIVQNTPTHALDLCIGSWHTCVFEVESGGVSGQELTSAASEVVLASFSHTQQPWQGPCSAW